MSALDRLNNYRADIGVPSKEPVGVFDLNTPEGVFLHLIHKNGFKMYEDDGTFTELHKVLTTSGNQKIQAIAGSGKTTSLIFKIMHDIVTGESMRNQTLPNGNTVRIVDNVFVGTFLRSGANELSQKLAKWQSALGYTVTATQVNFGTLHAEFKRCLNAMGVATPIGKDGVLSGLLRKAINSCSITRDGKDLKAEDYKIIESILMYYRGRLDQKRYQHPSAMDYNLTPSIIELLDRQYKQLKVAEGVMDFEDLQELLYKYLYVTPNPAVQDFCANRYNYIYLDEFQDTSQIQYAILKFYARDFAKEADRPRKGKIVVVGDVEQCIYSFRGSCIEVMHEMFDKDFDAVNNSLSKNYRCPSNILNPVKDSINLNLEAKGIEIIPARDGGIFRATSFTGITQMLRQLERDIDEDMNENLSVGILCRTNYDGMIPALYLEMLGKYRFSVSSEAMTLSSPLPKRMLRVGKLFTEKGTPAVKDVLTMFVSGYNQRIVKEIADVMKMNRLTIWTLPEEDLKYSCYELYEVIMGFKQMREKLGDDIKMLHYIYWFLRENVYGGDSAYCESVRACIDVIRFFLKEKSFSSVREFLEEMEDLNDRLEARVGKNYPISIATVHEFKGKERDSIYVWNDSDGVFPSNKTDIENYEQLSEERRVHYIACTRARKKSSIYTKAGSIGMFLREMDCEVQPCVVGLKTDIKDMKGV